MSASMLVDPILFSVGSVFALSNGESGLSTSSGLLEFRYACKGCWEGNQVFGTCFFSACFFLYLVLNAGFNHL